jgi:hypothetical protein
MSNSPFPSPRPSPLYVFSGGSTGHGPVPSGDPPDGTASGVECNTSCKFGMDALSVPLGGSPSGAGELPAPPALNKYSPLGRGRIVHRPVALRSSHEARWLLASINDEGSDRQADYRIRTGARKPFPPHEPERSQISDGPLTLSLSPSEGERVPKAGEGAVQGFNARSFVSGKSLPEGEGQGEGKRNALLPRP